MSPLLLPNLGEYYLWSKEVETRYPWRRQYLNHEFLNYEQKRINELVGWFRKFGNPDYDYESENVSFYVVPIKLNTYWKSVIAEHNLTNNIDFNYIGLSALFNSPNVTIIGLVSNSDPLPQEYRLIEITKSKRIFLQDKSINSYVSLIVIEEWDYLNSDKVYVDVPYERRIVQKILEESLTHDQQLSSSIGSPIVSAPQVSGSIGGIALSSISANGTFSQELIKTIQLMVPPEYRGLPPPQAAFNGADFHDKGFTFHLAERPFNDANYLFGTNDYAGLQNGLSKRSKYYGEFSIFSSVFPKGGTKKELWRNLFKDFTATEVTLPLSLEEIKGLDIDLHPLKNTINEDLWIQVVHNRQIRPRQPNNASTEKINKILREDLDLHLSDVYKVEKTRQYTVGALFHQMSYNVNRLAQSFARAEEKEDMNLGYLKKARSLVIGNFAEFINHGEFKRLRSGLIRNKENAKYDIVQAEIINNPASSIEEIYQSIESMRLFKNVLDLQGLLDWMHRKGKVIKSQNNRYTWVGF